MVLVCLFMLYGWIIGVLIHPQKNAALEKGLCISSMWCDSSTFLLQNNQKNPHHFLQILILASWCIFNLVASRYALLKCLLCGKARLHQCHWRKMYSLLLLLLFLGKMQSHLMHKISLMKQQEWEGILTFLCLFVE